MSVPSWVSGALVPSLPAYPSNDQIGTLIRPQVVRSFWHWASRRSRPPARVRAYACPVAGKPPRDWEARKTACSDLVLFTVYLNDTTTGDDVNPLLSLMVRLVDEGFFTGRDANQAYTGSRQPH